MMRVFYGQAKGNAHRYQCRGDDAHVGAGLCIGIGGVRVDRAMALQILEAVSDRAVEAAILASDQVERSRREIIAVERELEVARYEASLAARRYELVDPAKRHVARAAPWNVMLILDEIQTGLGRTGKLLAKQHDGIEADVTLLGKALSGGFYPVSAVLSNNAVLGTLKPGQHGSTFGGNPLACAVGRAALRVLVEEGMIENAAVQGVRFLDGLRSIRSNIIREVRGRGLMLAVELHLEAGEARRYCEALQGTGILAKDTHGHTIRIAPPLVITSEQVDWALKAIGATLKRDLS